MLHIHPVVSSSIDIVAYEDETSVLYLRFRENRALYAYDGVPPEVVAELLAFESKGNYVNEMIKPAFKARRVQRLPDSKPRR